jgi:predicted GIY-YIG superfamily endonuclease
MCPVRKKAIICKRRRRRRKKGLSAKKTRLVRLYAKTKRKASSKTRERVGKEKDTYVYVIYNADINSLYVGFTTDIARRIRQHNGDIKGGARATTRAPGEWKRLLKIGPTSTSSKGLKLEWAMQQFAIRKASIPVMKEWKRYISACDAELKRSIRSRRKPPFPYTPGRDRVKLRIDAKTKRVYHRRQVFMVWDKILKEAMFKRVPVSVWSHDKKAWMRTMRIHTAEQALRAVCKIDEAEGFMKLPVMMSGKMIRTA